MDIYNSMFSQSFIINEQIARQIFETIPEQGPVVLIIDNNTNCWPSDSDEFHKLNIDESFLKELCGKIDDGLDPVITYENNCCFIASQLLTENNHCGYVIIALPKYNSESVLENMSIFEMLLNQFSLIARLIEKNNRFYDDFKQKHSVKSVEQVSLN